MKNLVLAAFVGVLLYGSLMIYDYRDVVFYWDFAKPAGEIELEHNEQLEKAVELFLSSNETEGHETCVHQWFGRDDLFVYVKILCDEFVQEGDRYKAKSGALLQPARLEYDPTTNTVQSLELAHSKDFDSVRALFPKQVYTLMRGGDEPPQELLKKGFERQAQPPAEAE